MVRMRCKLKNIENIEEGKKRKYMFLFPKEKTIEDSVVQEKESLYKG